MRLAASTAIIVMVAILPCSAQGQLRSAAHAADSAAVTRNIYRRLFANIALSESQRHRAMAIISRSVIDQLTLMGQPVADVRARVDGIHLARDSSLRALLKNADERAHFDQNAMALRKRIRGSGEAPSPN